jgi:hypothetical protein
MDARGTKAATSQVKAEAAATASAGTTIGGTRAEAEAEIASQAAETDAAVADPAGVGAMAGEAGVAGRAMATAVLDPAGVGAAEAEARVADSVDETGTAGEAKLAADAAAAGLANPPKTPTVHGEFWRVLCARPDWLYGLLCSWGFGYGFLAYIVLFTHPDLTHDPKPTVVLVVLSAIADGSLTNQLAAEPEWASALLRAGEDPARILRVRNLMLYICELIFVCTVVALVARLGHADAWIPRALPQLAVLPLAPIAIGNLSSVLVPTPFMRLRHRFQAPGTWVRWAVYVAIPFVLSSVSLAIYWLPSKLEARYEPKVLRAVGSFKNKDVTVTLSSATHVYVAIWLVLMPLWLLVFWLLSLRLADGMARMRRRGLARLMARHTELVVALPDISLYQATRQLPTRVREIPTDLRAELKMISSELLEASMTLSRL